MFPDRIERTIVLPRAPHDVWRALTTAEGLGAWFGERATIDLRPGGAATMTFAGGMTVDMRVERVEEPAVFAYTWRLPDLPEDDPRLRPRPLQPIASKRPSSRLPNSAPLLADRHSGPPHVYSSSTPPSIGKRRSNER